MKTRRAAACSLAWLLIAAALVPSHAQSPAQPARSETAATLALESGARAELQSVLPQGRLVGQGRLKFWGLQVYDARLWAQPGFRAANFGSEPLALELNYLRSFDKLAIAERSIAEMRRAARISPQQAEAWTAALLKVIPDVQKGDRVMSLHQPGVGAAFWVNGLAAGEIRDAQFARLFFGIWLSPQTSEPALRAALLAGADA